MDEVFVVEEHRCHRCGHRSAPEQRFCGGCGAHLAATCGSCRSENPPGFRFCGGCGAPLDAPVAAAQRRSGLGEDEREERRWVSVVFADLSGFTRMSEDTDPEEVRAIVDRCVGHMADVIEGHGGWFDRVLGDGVLAVFGADTAHGDDAERAVRAALALLACSTERTDDFAGLRLSIGVNTGEVMFAAIGPRGRRDHTVMGDAVNTAARLQAAAPTGSIYVGQETWRATRATIRYEPAPPVDAKGKRDPVKAWVPLEAATLEAGRPVSGVPLVGREDERAALEHIWHRIAEDRSPHLVTVVGPPGIGKTKLAGELVQLVRSVGGRVALGRSLPYGERTGYGAFAKAMRQTLGILDSTPPREGRAILRAHVERLFPPSEHDETTEGLATLLGFGDSGTDKESLLFAARSFVEALARETPLLLVFEDIHWSEPSLLELIEVLATRCRDAPLLVLALARPELLDVAPRWGGGVPAHTALPLADLSVEDARRLAALHLGGSEMADLADRVASIADGNPLFIEELTASVLERATDADSELPSNVRTIIASRIDALPDDERAVLIDAAVVGKVFWQGALEGLGHPHLGRSLDALDRRDLIRREPQPRFEGEREFTFRHMLIREVAYATLPHSSRRARHAHIAEHLERVGAEHSVESAAALGHHWREAGRSERAVECLLAAAERAAGAWAAEEAVGFYTDALELLPEGDEDRRTQLVLARGLVRATAGFFAEAAVDLDEVLPRLRGRARAETLLARGNAAIWLMEGDHVTRCAEQALQAATSAGIAEELTGPALSLEAIGRSIDGRLEVALDLQVRALEAWRPGVRPSQLANDLGMMALTSYWAGHHERSIEHARQGYELAMQHRSVAAALQSGSHLGMALTGVGRHEEALEVFEKVVAQGRELERQPRLTSRTSNMMATTLREVGDAAEARLRNQEGIEHALAADFAAARIQGGIDLVFAAIDEGELGDARVRARALVGEVDLLSGWHQWLGWVRLALARAQLALAAGDAPSAAEAAADAVAQASAVGRPKYEARARVVLGAAHRRAGRHAEAVAELQAADAIARRLGHPPTRWQTAAALAAALADAGSDAQGAAIVEEATTSIDRFAAALSPLRRTQLGEVPAVRLVADLVRRIGA